MSRTPRNRVRRSAVCLIGLVCLLGVGACGTGFEAQTNHSYQAAEGSNERSEDVDAMNMVAVENSDGTATVSAALLAKTDDGDALTDVTGTDSDGDQVDIEFDGPLTLPKGDLVMLGEEPELVLSGDAVEAGYYVALDLQFETAAPVEVEVPIVERGEEGTYDSVAEAPEPEPTDSGDKAGKGNGDGKGNSDGNEG